jgi:hypothetical protein
MPFIHLAEILQGFAGNKLVGVDQAGSCSGNTPRLHLLEFVLGKTFFLGAVGSGSVIFHLAKKNKEG